MRFATRTSLFIVLFAGCVKLVASPIALYELPGELKTASHGLAVFRTFDRNADRRVTGSTIAVVDVKTSSERLRITSQQALNTIPGAAADPFWQSVVHYGFGASAALVGESVLIGSPGGEWICDCSVDPGIEVRGRHGTVFDYNIATGAQQRQWSPPSYAELLQESPFTAGWDWIGFGSNVAVDSHTLLVGRRAFNLTNGNPDFQLQRLTLDERRFTNNLGTFFNEDFEAPVAIGKNAILLSRWRNRENLRGEVGLYSQVTGQLQSILAPSTGQPEDSFGISIAVQGNLALIGAPTYLGHGSGSAYLFDLETGEQLFNFSAAPLFVDVNGRDNFGFSVALDGNLALIGAPADSQLNHDNGAAYLYDIITGNLLAKILPDSPVHAGRFGTNVALTRGFALIEDTAFLNSSQVSTTYVYALGIPEPTSKLLVSIGCFIVLSCCRPTLGLQILRSRNENTSAIRRHSIFS